MNDLMNDLIETTINNRMDEMVRQMNIGLYGDICPPPTRIQRIKRRVAMYRHRISDAWLVLCGKAYVE